MSRPFEKLVKRPDLLIALALGTVAVIVTSGSVWLYDQNIRRLIIDRENRAISAGSEVMRAAIQRKMDVLDMMATNEEEWSRALEINLNLREFEDVAVFDIAGQFVGGANLPREMATGPGEIGTSRPNLLSITAISPNRKNVLIGTFSTGLLRIESLVNPEQNLDASATAVLFDSRAEVVAATKPDIRGGLGDREGVQQALRGDIGVRIHRQRGPEILTAYTPVSTARGPTGLGLIYEQPLNTVVDPVSTFMVLVPFVGLLGTALAAFYLALNTRMRSAQSRMRDYARAITETQETERARLARELHDDTIQNLVVLHQHVQAARVDTQKDPNVGVRRLETLRGDIVEMINNVRRYSHALRPIYLEESTLDAALDKLAHESNETGIRMHPPCLVKFEPGSLTRPINNDVKLTMFRIAQEAITNALKHSRANTVRLILEEVGTSGVRLTVEDDGRGFDKEAVRDGLGLVNIRERAAMIEARVVMETAPGAGTRIQVTLP